MLLTDFLLHIFYIMSKMPLYGCMLCAVCITYICLPEPWVKSLGFGAAFHFGADVNNKPALVCFSGNLAVGTFLTSN